MKTEGKITYLPLDEYRYRSMLEHLTWLGKQQGWHEYAEHKARQYSRFDAELYGQIPADLGRQLKEKYEPHKPPPLGEKPNEPIAGPRPNHARAI